MGTIVGIDPGKRGGIVVWDTLEGKVSIHGTTQEDISVVLREIDYQAYIYLEQVHASQQMGVSSAFNFGLEYGKLIGAFFDKYLINYVTPQKWQAALNCRTGGNKNISKARAKELFPDVKVTLENADALLICYYGYTRESL